MIMVVVEMMMVAMIMVEVVVVVEVVVAETSCFGLCGILLKMALMRRVVGTTTATTTPQPATGTEATAVHRLVSPARTMSVEWTVTIVRIQFTRVWYLLRSLPWRSSLR